MQVEDRKVQDLHQDPENSRKHDERNLQAIRESLEAFGQQKPIVIDQQGKVVAGNGTLEAARQLGWETIQAVVTQLDGPTQTAFAIADNRTAELAAWDDDQLAQSLVALENDESIDAAITGFDSKEIDKMVEAMAGGNEVIEDEIPENVEPVTKPGDLWKLGRHRLLCGDSTNPQHFDRLMDNQKADLVVTDPPYAIFGSSTGVSSSVADDKMVRPFFETVLRTAHNNVREFAHLYVFCDWRSWSGWIEASKRASLTISNMLVWDKGDFGLGSNYRNNHELVGFMQRLPVHDSHMKKKKTGQRSVHEPNIIRMNRTGQGGFESEQEKGQRFHNAAKPVALCTKFIENSSETGDLVLDLFLGSGTTMIAADQSGRRCFGMEMEPSFCDVIVTRWENLTGEKAERIKE